MRNDIVAKLRAFDFRAAFHQPREIISHALAADRAVQAFQDQIGRFRPAQVTQHHFAAQHDGTGIDLVLVGIFRGRAVRGFKNSVAGNVVDIAARCDADAADLRRQRVAQIIAVQVQAWQ